jgi:hypothetical protein
VAAIVAMTVAGCDRSAPPPPPLVDAGPPADFTAPVAEYAPPPMPIDAGPVDPTSKP